MSERKEMGKNRQKKIHFLLPVLCFKGKIFLKNLKINYLSIFVSV